MCLPTEVLLRVMEIQQCNQDRRERQPLSSWALQCTKEDISVTDGSTVARVVVEEMQELREPSCGTPGQARGEASEKVSELRGEGVDGSGLANACDKGTGGCTAFEWN